MRRLIEEGDVEGSRTGIFLGLRESGLLAGSVGVEAAPQRPVEIGADLLKRAGGIAAIQAAREAVLKTARERTMLGRAAQQIIKGGRKPRGNAQVIDDPLPEDITIVIRDLGHGMTPADMANRFLPSTETVAGRKPAVRRIILGIRIRYCLDTI